jgi:beta-lactamase regulating signal transducer with metallopeptidase domain
MTELLVDFIPVLGRALLHFVWQGALVGLLAALALHLLRDARPQARYAVACMALLACTMMPIAYVLFAQWVPPTPSAVPVQGAAFMQAATLAVGSVPVSPGWMARFEGALPTIVMLWAAGACTLSLRMGVGLLWIQRLRGTPQAPMQREWQARLDALAQRFGLRRAVALRLVATLASPVSAGWWRPVVLLPAGLLARMPIDLVEALLAHELAHIKRHDYLVNLLQNLAEALLFYHPVTWWLSRRIRIEREHIADGLAAEVTGQPRRLALALSELAEWSCSHTVAPSSPHLAQAAHGGHLMSRIEQLVRPGQRPVRGGIALPLVGVAVACLAFYAHAQIKPDAKPVATPAANAQAKADAASKAAGTNAPSKPATQATPAASAKPAAGATPAVRSTARANRDDQDSYALISKGRDGIRMNGSTEDLPAIRQAQRSLTNTDFVWLRRDGKTYVVSDADTLAKVREAWRDSDRIGEQMEVLGDQMEVHGDRMEALGAQMEKLAPKAGESAALEAASRRMEQLGEQQGELAERQSKIATQLWRVDGAERDRLEASMDELSRQQDELGRRMDEQSRVIDREAANMDRNSEPMEALGRQMDEAGKPMDALGKQMDALGKEQEKYIEEAERKTRALLDSAIARGLARPLPLSAQ